jgi:hypothetical protein
MYPVPLAMKHLLSWIHDSRLTHLYREIRHSKNSRRWVLGLLCCILQDGQRNELPYQANFRFI